MLFLLENHNIADTNTIYVAILQKKFFKYLSKRRYGFKFIERIELKFRKYYKTVNFQQITVAMTLLVNFITKISRYSNKEPKIYLIWNS